MCTINKLFRLMKISELIIGVILIFMIPVLIRLNSKVNFIYIVLTSNYITLIINVYYFVIVYKKLQVINFIKYYLIQRWGLKKAKITIHIFVSIYTLLFSIVLYSFLFVIYGCHDTTALLLVLLMLNTVLYLIEINFIALQFNRKSNALFVVVPIIMNFVFHYLFFV